MTYTIRHGDTLSTLAQRYGTSVQALMRQNPSIRNASRIFVGQQLVIPGSRDEFVPAAPTTAPSTSASSSSTSPYQLARSVLGRNASELKRSSGAIGRAMHDGIPNTVNCANFVSACLEVAGQITRSQHSDSVVGLQAKLDRDPDFRRVTLANAQPGDVVSFRTAHGHHVVMFAGWQNGRPMFIGSNNVNSDGSQRVSVASMNYTVMSVHHYDPRPRA